MIKNKITILFIPFIFIFLSSCSIKKTENIYGVYLAKGKNKKINDTELTLMRNDTFYFKNIYSSLGSDFSYGKWEFKVKDNLILNSYYQINENFIKGEEHHGKNSNIQIKVVYGNEDINFPVENNILIFINSNKNEIICLDNDGVGKFSNQNVSKITLLFKKQNTKYEYFPKNINSNSFIFYLNYKNFENYIVLTNKKIRLRKNKLILNFNKEKLILKKQ